MPSQPHEHSFHENRRLRPEASHLPFSKMSNDARNLGTTIWLTQDTPFSDYGIYLRHVVFIGFCGAMPDGPLSLHPYIFVYGWQTDVLLPASAIKLFKILQTKDEMHNSQKFF